MAINSTIAVRRGALALLKMDPKLTAIVPAERIYPQTTPASPTWPFIRAGAPASAPINGSCLDGADIAFAMHGFAQPRTNGAGAVVETAEDYAGRIGEAIAAALDKRVIILPSGKASIRWTGDQLLQDPDEAGAFHTVQNFRVRAITG